MQVLRETCQIHSASELDQSNGRRSEFELLERLWDVLDKHVWSMEAPQLTWLSVVDRHYRLNQESVCTLSCRVPALSFIWFSLIFSPSLITDVSQCCTRNRKNLWTCSQGFWLRVFTVDRFCQALFFVCFFFSQGLNKNEQNMWLLLNNLYSSWIQFYQIYDQHRNLTTWSPFLFETATVHQQTAQVLFCDVLS